MDKKLEEILGGKVESERKVPGTVIFKGREWWYIEDDNNKDFDTLFHKVVRAVNPPYCTEGGAITGGCELTLPDGRKFHAMSYKGDLEGWRKQISEGANILKLATANIKNNKLVLSDGHKILLSDCKVRFY